MDVAFLQPFQARANLRLQPLRKVLIMEASPFKNLVPGHIVFHTDDGEMHKENPKMEKKDLEAKNPMEEKEKKEEKARHFGEGEGEKEGEPSEEVEKEEKAKNPLEKGKEKTDKKEMDKEDKKAPEKMYHVLLPAYHG